jgi:prevent-host-death family protein
MIMQQITLESISETLRNLVEAALNGEEVIITKNNKPVIKLTPVSPVKKPRQPGSAKGLVIISDDFDEPLEDFKDYM